MTNPVTLGVNIDHVATLRQARGTRFPNPVYAALAAEYAAADPITCHLREDRRHNQERDLLLIKQAINTRLNLEIAVTDEMLAFACELKPEEVCLVPEKRDELTTEGGLDVAGHIDQMKHACNRLAQAGIRVSPFIDASHTKIEANVLVTELNIGHAIVSDVVFLGLSRSIQDMKQRMLEARAQGS